MDRNSLVNAVKDKIQMHCYSAKKNFILETPTRAFAITSGNINLLLLHPYVLFRKILFLD